MRFLVLGATGMAGHTIAFYLQEQGHEIVSFSRQVLHGCQCVRGDVRDLDRLYNLIASGNFDYVINCVGVLNQFADKDRENAVFVNSYLPQWLAKVLQKGNTRLIQMSTDCVFSGDTGGYSEMDVPDGRSFYDRSKALGEIDDQRNLTFRNSIVGPDMREQGIGLFNWFMRQSGEINGYTKSIWSGVTTLTLAKAMEQAAVQNITGIYHLTNNERINKYDLLRIFKKYFKEDSVRIRPIKGIEHDKSLINTRNDFHFVVPSYDQMIKEMYEWILGHKALYPHYKVVA